MEKKTHIAAGLILTQIITSKMGISNEHVQAQAFALGGLFAIIPDIDMPQSAIGRKVPVSHVLGLFVRHRTFTHSLFAMGAVYFVLTQYFSSITDVLLLSALAGYVSHLLMDMLNPQGIMLLWPFNVWIRLPSFLTIPTGGIIERMVILPLLIASFSYLIMR